jgi:hypothetical protein
MVLFLIRTASMTVRLSTALHGNTEVRRAVSPLQRRVGAVGVKRERIAAKIKMDESSFLPPV